MIKNSLKCVILFFLLAGMVAFFSGCSSASTGVNKSGGVATEPVKKTTKEDAERFLKSMEKGMGISLSTSNFEKYFTINLDGSYYKDSAQIKYSIEPKTKINIQDSGTVFLSFKISIYETKYASNEIASTDLKVNLCSENEFRLSDQISIDLPSSDYEKLFWNHELSYCFGTVYVQK